MVVFSVPASQVRGVSGREVWQELAIVPDLGLSWLLQHQRNAGPPQIYITAIGQGDPVEHGKAVFIGKEVGLQALFLIQSVTPDTSAAVHKANHRRHLG
jgi:hypothetical protein